MGSRDENVYMAKLAEQAERYDEMVRSLGKAQQGPLWVACPAGLRRGWSWGALIRISRGLLCLETSLWDV